MSDITVDDVLNLFAKESGRSFLESFLEGKTEFDSAIELASNLRSSIMQNRDNLQQSRIDIQQTRIESQQTRLDLANYKEECSALFNAFEQKVNDLIELSNNRSELLISDIKVICEEQIEQKVGSQKKRKLSETEEELLSLTDPYYVPTGDDIYDSHENSEQEQEQDEEDEEEQSHNGDDHPEHEADLNNEDENQAAVDAADQALEESVPKLDTKKLPLYKMIRGADSIKLIWEEYTKGVNGGPAVRDLERQYQGRWKDDTERKYFSYRKKLYQLIEKIVEIDGKSEDGAIEYVEQVLAEQPGSKRSMTWLYDNLSLKYL